MAIDRTYIAIDLKSFYASVECMERGLDPLATNLVVADLSRTEKTICLAVSPSLKALGISGRARMFEVVQQVALANGERLTRAGTFEGESNDATALAANPRLKIGYIVAPPRMAHYIEASTRIYKVYLRHVAPQDIHVYSIDEVFIDVTGYLNTLHTTAHDFAMLLIKEVLAETGITATAGIGPNLYLAKIAMDIVAKHVAADAQGVRIAELSERSYRETLWNHLPITDFWRVGPGYARRLESIGIYTMGDVARRSLSKHGEDQLYKLFGVNAELLIDHAWGWEPVEIAHIKAYRPESNSIGGGQVLERPYAFREARLVMQEMADQLALDLTEKGLTANQLVLTVGYDVENLGAGSSYTGEVVADVHGRHMPKHAHGTANLEHRCASSRLFTQAALRVFDEQVNPTLTVRRLNLTACHVLPVGVAAGKGAEAAAPNEGGEQLDLFASSDDEQVTRQEQAAAASELLEREGKLQEAVVAARQRFGKNAVLKGMDLKEGATRKDRNARIGGHKA